MLFGNPTVRPIGLHVHVGVRQIILYLPLILHHYLVWMYFYSPPPPPPPPPLCALPIGTC